MLPQCISLFLPISITVCEKVEKLDFQQLYGKPQFTFVIQRISSNDSSGQEAIAESSSICSTMATTTDGLLYKPDEIMHALAAYVMRVR